MINRRKGKPAELPLTEEAFSRFKDRLEGERFGMLEACRAELHLEAVRICGAYRLRVAVAMTMQNGPEMFLGFPYKAEARMTHVAGPSLPGNLISWAFPNLRHGHIALRHEEIGLAGMGEGGPYRGSPAGVVSTGHVDIAHMLRAGEELMRAREEASRLANEVLARTVSRKRMPDRAVVELMVERVRESARISAAIGEHVPDLS